ncbi:MAG: amidohydrolase [Planctomycetota bacterium]
MRDHQSAGWRIQPADIERVVPFEALLDRIADERRSDWIARRRFLHANPEPSGYELKTTQYIAEALDAVGISAQFNSRDVGLMADLSIGTPDDAAPLIAIRADIDALRMHDRKTVPYASSCPGLSHSCGHDAHTTIVLAVAELLAAMPKRLPESEVPSARFRFIFQPAEETAEGAAWMVDDGAIRNVDAILGLHVDPSLPAGRVGIRYGVLTAQVDEVQIHISGQGGHAARPHHTTDPIGTAAMLVSSLYQAVPRRANSLNPTVFTVGSIHGGTASNIIPDHVEILGTLRSTDRNTRETVMNTIRKISEGLAAATHNDITVSFRSPLGSVVNDVTVMSACEAAAIQVLGGQNLVLIDNPSMGGEDFAVYLDHVRGGMFRLGCAGATGNWPLLHSPIFDIEERAIPIGARILSRTALILALMPPESPS